MAHLSLYRKYRSQSFSDLVGQDHVVKALQNAIASGRVAHAYLFTGPRGTGKTSTARLLAKCLCQPGGPTKDPDPESEISLAIATGSCVDVVEMDAASESGVDDIRQAIVEAVEYQPMMCPYKVFIIDEVHDLSTKAFDALLKTIEEPPPHVVFILATTEYNKVPSTIRSRCQKFEFHRASISDLVKVLSEVAKKEQADISDSAIEAVARMADGGYRDALTLLEQLLLVVDGPVGLEHVQMQLGLLPEDAVDRLLQAIAGNDGKALLGELDAVFSSGRDPRSVLESLMYRLSDLTRAAFGVEGSDDKPREATLRSFAAQIGADRLVHYRAGIAELIKAIRDVSLPRLWTEAQLHALAAGPAIAAEKPAPAPKVAAKPAAKESPKPEAPAKVGEPKAAESRPAEPKAPAPKVAVSDDPELAEIQSLWSTMLQSLPATAHPLKLEGSAVIGIKGHQISVTLLRKIHVDWYEENPQRIGYIINQLKGVADRPWSIKFLEPDLEGNERPGVAEEPQTVELPLEGQALHDKIVALFQS